MCLRGIITCIFFFEGWEILLRDKLKYKSFGYTYINGIFLKINWCNNVINLFIIWFFHCCVCVQIILFVFVSMQDFLLKDTIVFFFEQWNWIPYIKVIENFAFKTLMIIQSISVDIKIHILDYNLKYWVLEHECLILIERSLIFLIRGCRKFHLQVCRFCWAIWRRVMLFEQLKIDNHIQNHTKIYHL